jgi:hypothetical protein
MKASLLLLPVSVLSAVALAACGSSSSNTTVTSGGSQINAAANHRAGTTLYVGRWPGLHHTYRTIQAAVNAARPGDRVLIAAGDYHESPNSGVGVRVTVPDVVIEGVDRNTVIVDGTKPGARSPCDPDPRFQNFGPVLQLTNGIVRDGRNGIVIDHASGVTVENLTVCNFVGISREDEFGNELWFNGGAGSGKTGLGPYRVANVTATSTYIPTATSGQPGPEPIPTAARTGVLISNAAGPGKVIHSFASNMADAGFHIAGCPDCNAVFDHDTANHNVIGLSATDAGGRLLLEHSLFEHDGDGVNLASENNEDAPPPQDGACPPGVSGPEPIAPGICTVIEHDTVEANNNADVSPDVVEEPEGLLGVGIDIAGGKHDLVLGNHVSDQGSYGILTTVSVDALTTGSPGPRFPNADCQQGRLILPGACFFNASGNLIADNTLRHDGTFANPTNGDLADATVADSAPNCYRGNTDRSGRPTTAPHGSQPEDCAGRRGGTRPGALEVQVVCAARAFGGCHWGTGNAVLNSLATLSHLLHIPFDAAAVRNARAIYPSPGHYVAPQPATQPSLHPTTRP